MSSAEAVKKWRRETKKRMIDSMGGECQLCGYNKCQEALELHHINPDEKELSFGAIRANPKAWLKIVEELKKCILLCSNCHKEVHYGIVKMPLEYESFNEDYTVYKETMSECPVCGGQKAKRNKTCSHKCAAKLTGTIEWGSVDLKKLLEKYNYNCAAVGRILDVSDNTVRKRAKKLKLM